jgi:hypothetical protein
LGLRAKLTFKVLQEDGLGGNLLLTSWNDLSGVEFQAKAWNEDALRINALLEVSEFLIFNDMARFLQFCLCILFNRWRLYTV